MSTPTPRDPDRLLHAFLEEGPAQMSDRLQEAIRDEIFRTRQRGVIAPWRFPSVNRMTVIAAAAVLVVIAGAVALVARPTDVATRPTGAPSASPTPKPALMAPLGYHGSGTIAYVGPDPATGDNAGWLINPDGSHQTPLSVRALPASGPAALVRAGCCALFSPDGTRIAIAYDETDGSGGPGTWTQTRILNLDGSNLENVPRECGGCGYWIGLNFVPRAWSPDGKLLALETWSDSQPGRDGINIAPVGGIDGVAVTAGHRDVPVAFSPDSNRLLFVRLTGAESGALMEVTIAETISPGLPGVEVQPGAVRQITPDGMLVLADGYFGPAASWSADGRQIAFAATDATGNTSKMSVYVVASGRGAPRQLTAPASFVTTAKWSPDSRWIAYDSEGPGFGHDLFIIRADGSGQTNLTEHFAPGICCSRWSPDSKALLAAGTMTTDDQSELFIVPINGDPPSQVTTEPGIYEDFSWGPATRK